MCVSALISLAGSQCPLQSRFMFFLNSQNTQFLGPLPIAVARRRSVGRSVRLSTSVTQQPMFRIFSKSV